MIQFPGVPQSQNSGFLTRGDALFTGLLVFDGGVVGLHPPPGITHSHPQPAGYEAGAERGRESTAHVPA